MRLWVLLSILMCCMNSFAGDSAEADCAAIEDSDKRLACYDARFSRQAPAEKPVQTPATDPAEAPPAVVATPIIASPAEGVQSAEPAPAPPVASDASPETGFLGDTKVDLRTSIRAIHAGEKQKMVFLLDNDQVWIQSSPRPLPFSEGDAVTVKNATLGGYFMRSEKGTSTRVQRIR